MKEVNISMPEKHANEEPKTCYFPRRYVLVILGFIGMFNVYAMRVNLSVAMVAMVNQTTDKNSSIHQITECPNLLPNEPQNKTIFKGDQYNWDTTAQGHILGSFFYGYIATQLPGGILSEKFGAKWLFGGGVLVTAVLSLLTPVAASWGTAAFIVVRVLEGLGEGVTFPAINFAISTWAPKIERSRLSTLIFTGNQFGNVVSMSISGVLCSTDFLGGWPSCFYVFGAIGCVWFLFWGGLIYETPASHPSISKEELFFIEQNKDEKPKEKAAIPWKSIFTSVPMWALVFAHIGHNFGFLILLTEMPTYLSSILHFDLKSNGVLSALPYIAQALTAWVASYIADKLRKSNKLSITTIRKVFNSIGLFGPAICLIGITVSGCRPELIVVLLTFAMAFNGCVYSGFNVTHVDMCPEYAGTTFAITMAISNFSGIIGPAIVGYFTSNGQTIANWSDVFYTAAGVYTVCGAIFAGFGSAELQSWGTTTEKSKTDAKPEKEMKELEVKNHR
ncbi:putative inorganic phosphate cotransporter isoform X2 [Parasteatoda tepidariorum]|uniref:putative inorganic phosphate cotransporter isoform X2 n=1 Tax=Parasteatoda tepidariorum TaxID=114398 RepID=UPI00077FB7A8|nr:putative inorganic phosphate cotransporter isoform X2 [Parasteatoda tepidariorum]XP_021000940.1 putative inorganic phosphate cotransporter isoform X2 [Parasteatoda tepidariorum]XP_042904074.1 putative inorganic phosphate cotransporter isoform X2 [Parasteatoda tepidariorum]